MNDVHGIESVRVHLTGSDIPLGPPPATTRPRRGLSLRTFTLTTADPVQQILPQNANRCEAWVQCADAPAKPFSVHVSAADAQAGRGVTIPTANTGPYPLHTTDAVWATAAATDLPVQISVTAVIEGE